MNLAVTADQTLGPDQHGCVEEPGAGFLEHPADDERVEFVAEFRDTLSRRAGNSLRQRHRVIFRVNGNAHWKNH